MVVLPSLFGWHSRRDIYEGTENVAIYAFSSGKFLNVRVHACVKYLTNIMSDLGRDHHRNPNNNERDHLVGQSNMMWYEMKARTIEILKANTQT